MSIKLALQVTNDQIEEIRKFYNVTQDSIERDVKILKEWMGQQPHFPLDVGDKLLERLLLRNKFRIEETKRKIEAYFTVRGLYLEYYTNYLEIIPSQLPAMFLYLPKLTPNNHRIILCKLRYLNGNFEDLNFLNIVSSYILSVELTQRFDYNSGVHYVLDCTNFDVSYIKKINPSFMARSLKLLQNAYSARLHGIHYINVPSSISIILNVMKALLKPKFFEKIKIHSNLETLFEEIPQELFPKEYGGKTGEVTALLELWDQVFEENRKIFEDNLQKVSDERKRIGNVKNNDLFGVDGTFRRINID